MASIANQNNNVDKMDIRGVKIQVLQDISKQQGRIEEANELKLKYNIQISE